MDFFVVIGPFICVVVLFVFFINHCLRFYANWFMSNKKKKEVNHEVDENKDEHANNIESFLFSS